MTSEGSATTAERGPAVRAMLNGAVGVVELNRPPHNFADADMMRELANMLTDLGSQDSCRAIVVAAEGRSFCAGANFSSAPSAQAVESGKTMADIFRLGARGIYAEAERIFAIPRPMIAAVHGAAVGAGLGLALACDLRVTCPEARFLANFARLGIHPGFALSLTLPRLLGPGRAADLMLTGRVVYGDEAFKLGLADRVVPQAEVRQTALALAAEIAAAAPLAVQATRATLRRGLVDEVRATLAIELEEQAQLMGTVDALEGISAMIARREPQFKGR